MKRIFPEHITFKTKAIATVAAIASIVWAKFIYASEAPHAPSLAIDEGTFVEINGMQQWITIRGHDLNKPALLFLHGGPGIGLSGMAPIFSEWEKHYVVVHWDQPSSGATYIKNSETGQGALTIERYTRDGIAVANFVRKRLGKQKLILMGTSWGTIIGLEMIRQEPALFSAYVGTAQVVSGKDGSKLGYDLALQAARERNDSAAIAALERVGAPPYKSLQDFLVRQQYSNPPGLPASAAEQTANLKVAKLFSSPPPADARYNAYKTLPPGFNPTKMFMDTLQSTYHLTWTWEARDLGMEFAVPVFIFQGENDINTPHSLAREYLEQIKAPRKAFATIPGAGHNTIVFNMELLQLLKEHLAPIASQ